MTKMLKCTGIRMFDDNRGLPWRRLAEGDIQIQNIGLTLKDVTLTWSPQDGFCAIAPRDGDFRLDRRGELAAGIAVELEKFWRKMGGTLPKTPTDSDVTGLHRTLGIEKQEAFRACG